MRLNRARLLGLALMGGLLPAFFSSAQAQGNWPNRPIRVIVPFGAGGTTDLLARMVGQEVSKSLGQPLIIDNRVGAGGNIGSDVCAKAPPDGYTLCVGTISSHAINASVYPNMPFNNLKDFAPVALLGSQPNLLVVGNEVPAKNLAELIALVKANPGKYNYGSSGVGTSTHLAGELLMQMIGGDAVHVPYRSSGAIMTDILGGVLPMTFDNFSSAWPHAKEGRMRAIAVGSAERAPQAPDVPTVGETLPGFVSVSWHGMFAPAGTPKPIVERLNREVLAATRSPELTARYQELGVTRSDFAPEAFADFVASETKRWGDVARKANIRAE